ncbi:hypothetical protein EVAR_87234_1 [Eumeta japonica]|uniref:Uncharacterized protein n=1 Tax=Eumeta variegata TaxID=151549 RepID=A0A4C1YR02_EUMVA|nr:hypothetical protein EVAR_87234_1 [Eumeta japonica]
MGPTENVLIVSCGSCEARRDLWTRTDEGSVPQADVTVFSLYRIVVSTNFADVYCASRAALKLQSRTVSLMSDNHEVRPGRRIARVPWPPRAAPPPRAREHLSTGPSDPEHPLSAMDISRDDGIC